ncbi:UNKNOWN [Stylonychia lemnae]|uniref:Uncharacterized protein n=1 Tax=Stylonychia lemnae TaxID=5949 RepID=A0A078AJ86_STYLE|nr:UNKNOWN [Stylonychia lemnae]|eukprot:CDW81966.1 UNKNOWN [Stylonychia lemnae]
MKTQAVDQRRQSMTYLSNALSQITQEEKKKSMKQRLTQLQKNRIALNYIRARESAEDINLKSYRDSDGSDEKVTKQAEKKSIINMMTHITDYISNKNIEDPVRSSTFIRKPVNDGLFMYGVNPYASNQSVQQRRQSRVSNSPFDVKQNDNGNYVRLQTQQSFYSSTLLKSSRSRQNSTQLGGLRKTSYDGGQQFQDNQSNFGGSMTLDESLVEQNLLKQMILDNSQYDQQHNRSVQALYPKNIDKTYYSICQDLQVIDEKPAHSKIIDPLQQNSMYSNLRNSQQSRSKSHTAIHQSRLDRIKIKCQFALQEQSDLLYKKVQDKIVDEIQDAIEINNNGILGQSKLANEMSANNIRKLKNSRLKQQIKIIKERESQEFKGIKSLPNDDFLREEIEYENEYGNKDQRSASLLDLERIQKQKALDYHTSENPKGGQNKNNLNENTEASSENSKNNFLKQFLFLQHTKAGRNSKLQSRLLKRTSQMSDELNNASLLLPKYKIKGNIKHAFEQQLRTSTGVGGVKEEQLARQADRTIERIDEFEKANTINKISVKEISEKYKDFNLRRNLRLKNKIKLEGL